MRNRRSWCCAVIGCAAMLAQSKKPSFTNWSDYAGGADSMQYSALKQIDKSNVNKLELAWSFLVPGKSVRFVFNPVIVDGVMYVMGKDDSIVALDAASGKQLWSHPVEGTATERGINYWESKDRSDRRLIFSVNSYLQEINAKTGVTVNTFGNDGKVDLREGLGRDPKMIRNIQSRNPGRIFENTIIVGSAPGEMYGSPPGDVRGYDVLTGKMTWIFHTVPHPGEFGYETWPPDAWKYAGGANTWGEITVDEKHGIVYFPLGSPTYDLYGADRKGANLFGNCLLALDARTGSRLWHFQAVHHDLWDYDLTTAPKLLTVKHNGKMVDVVAQASKSGFVYVFNRVTGEPLWPIEERPVPQSDVPGEESWPTQPFPTKPPPFARQTFAVDDVNPYVDSAEKERLKQIVRSARNEGVFTPPTLTRFQIQFPGAWGGGNWGAAAVDPPSGWLYVRTLNQPSYRQLSERNQEGPPAARGGTPEQRGFALYSRVCMECHGPERTNLTSPAVLAADHIRTTVRSGRGPMPAFDEETLSHQDLDAIIAYLNNPAAGTTPGRGRGPAQARGRGPALPPPPPGQTRYFANFGAQMLANNGLPAIGPPWTELVAYDLNEGVIKWRIPVGTVSELAAKGIRDTGSYRPRNGPVVTAGGLIFLGSTPDGTIRAYDKDTGKTLWEKQLDANPEGLPAVYETGGREYVVFAASAGDGPGAGTMAWRPGKIEAQGYHVFALPAPATRTKK